MAIPVTAYKQRENYNPDPSPQLVFHHVGGKNGNDRFAVLKLIFDNILTPLYGSQEDSLQKIKKGQDRTCYLLYEGENPVGVAAFKTLLSDEFAEYNVKNSIEIKSLFVVHSGDNSGKGFGTILLNKIVEETNKLQLSHQSYHVTVSETKSESLIFFKRKGFNIIHKWNGRYQEKTIEYLLACPSQLLMIKEIPTTSPEVDFCSKKFQQLHIDRQPTQEPSTLSPKIIFVIHNAHWDDIHTLNLLSDGSFISGSKDNSLCKWTQNGQLIRVVREVEPEGMNAQAWITACAVLNDQYWISGERNGRICLWNTVGDFIKTYTPKLPTLQHFSHPLNLRRINCLSSGANKNNPTFFIGFPTMFDEYDVIAGRSISTQVHDNDWVYCIHPLTETRILLVIAGVLEIWEKFKQQWYPSKVLLQEARKAPRQGRSFISSLTPLESSPNYFGVGIFNGDVKAVDMEQSKVVHQWHEHKEKVWTLENLSPNTFASGSDDRSIKLWDIRSPKSICTIGNHLGGVSTLLNLDSNIFIAGSCPENPIEKNEGAQLLFYDKRK